MTKARTPAGLVGADGGETTVTVPPPADSVTPPRRPCRVCKRPDARPVMPIGSSRWWDLCHRCTRIVTRAYIALGGAS